MALERLVECCSKSNGESILHGWAESALISVFMFQVPNQGPSGQKEIEGSRGQQPRPAGSLN